MNTDETTARVPRFAIALILACPVLLIGVLILAVVERNLIIPPRGVVSLTTFAEVMPPAKKFVRVDLGGAPRFVWIGEKVSWAFRSGPPCYVFDSSGKLAEWDWETGTGQNTSALAKMAQNAASITVDDAMAYILAPVAGD